MIWRDHLPCAEWGVIVMKDQGGKAQSKGTMPEAHRFGDGGRSSVVSHDGGQKKKEEGACGGCLGVECRRRTWAAAKSIGE